MNATPVVGIPTEITELSDLLCFCPCHLGLRPSKAEVKAFQRKGVDGTDIIATLSACESCALRHAECANGMRVCRCGHPKWKHVGDDGCAGTYAERCTCLEFIPAEEPVNG